MKKKAIIFTCCFYFAGICFSQKVRRIENLKDAMGNVFNYTGEVVNGKPEGMGIANYLTFKSKFDRYVGHFANGMFNGKGILVSVDYSFTCGNWENGEATGKCTSISANGIVYKGDIVKGQLTGQGVLITRSNEIYQGGFKNGQIDGRCLIISADGTIINDNLFQNGIKNGNGFQYEVKSKQLFRGLWKDGAWVTSTEPEFKSFLQAPDFYGEINDKQIIAAPVKNKVLHGLSFYYDMERGKRYLGTFSDSGDFQEGVVVQNDANRFFGQLDKNGATGYCYEGGAAPEGYYYTEGKYTNDKLNGNIINIEPEKNAAPAIYFGNAENGYLTGKAYFFNSTGDMHFGDYVKGSLAGKGYLIDKMGIYKEGIWRDGKIIEATALRTPMGETINIHPKSFEEALNMAFRAESTDYDFSLTIVGSQVPDSDILKKTVHYTSLSTCLVDFPNAVGPSYFVSDKNNIRSFYIDFIETKEAALASKKYHEIAKLIAGTTLSNPEIKGVVQLNGHVIPPDVSKNKTVSIFILPKNIALKYDYETKFYQSYQARLIIEKKDNGLYSVYLEMGSGEPNEDDDSW